MLHCTFLILLAVCLSSWLGVVQALSFDLPGPNNVVGVIQRVISQHYEPIADLGRRYEIGVYEMIEANPEVDPWAPEPGSTIIIPTRFVLPSGPKEGIVINLAEMRLYYYHPKEAKVSTFPVGIGKPGWPTPTGHTTITAKREHPYWHVPQSIRAGHAKNGRLLPTVVPPGPTNPLGEYAMNLGLPGYLIHGTIHPGGIGMRSTHGCIRMHPEHIEWLFKHVGLGTQVRIVHEPLKIGLVNNDIVLEAHLPISDAKYKGSNSVDALVNTIHRVIGKITPAIHWDRAERLIRTGSGIPEAIGQIR